MPYMIVKHKNKWLIYKQAGGKPTGAALGSHDSEESAKKQLAALYANENKSANPLKAISLTDTEYRVGNYIVLFGGNDLERSRFAPDVDVESEFTAKGILPVGFEHGEDEEVGKDTLGYVDWKTAKRDEKGIFVERVLDMRNKYVKFLKDLVDAGLIGNSSEAVPAGIKATGDRTIVKWPLRGDTLTVKPMEPRMITENALQAIKALSEVFPAAKQLLKNKKPNCQSGSKGEVNPPAGRTQNGTKIKSNNGAKMDILEAIKKLVPGLSDEQIQQIAAVMGLAGMQTTPTDEPVMDEAGEPIKSVPLSKLVTELKALGYTVSLPGLKQERKPAVTRPVFDNASEKDPEAENTANAQKALDAHYVMRFGEEDAAKKAILGDVIGADYRQRIYNQNEAFARYLRGGERALSVQDVKALQCQVFPLEMIQKFVKDGMSISDIKATQVEAQGELGGYAVPPNVQSNITTRLPGLTAVRGAGANVITLARGNSIEIPQYRSTDTTHRYVGELRGQWGTETADPTAQNIKLDMVAVLAHVYTYKVPMSQSLVEDAANLVSLVERDIADTLAIDEDECFLVGDGVGKPTGILPGGSNSFSLTEVASGGSSTLTAAKVKALKRGIPTQYRKNAVWVGNSDTFSAIEQLTYATTGQFVFEDLSETDMLLKRKVFESEAMPDVGSGTYPLLFGDMFGYDIVERLGMTIARFQDSNTGINKVEFHVRRRIGGRIERTWLFAVQKVASS